MGASIVVYTGLVLTVAGLAVTVKPVRRLGIRTRARAMGLAGAGALLAGTGFMLPVTESRVARATTRLDEFAPVWQFDELHTISIDAPPARVFDAVKQVRADEIRLFAALTWIRRGGQPLPESILDAGSTEPLIDVATRSGFVRLAEDAPRELVIGTVVMAPPGARGPLTPEVFQQALPPGFALAAMNFIVTADGPNRSLVSTETRVFANSPWAIRRFAAYWRLIYPGSALIRRMWLRAIARRATESLANRTGQSPSAGRNDPQLP
jgi:hypothetical protein